MENKTIFVTGGSGKVGGPVALSLINKGFNVRVLARKPSSPTIQHLKSLGAEIIEGDLNHRETFEDSLRNVDGLFCVLSYDYGVAKEIRQGFLITNLAKEHNIGHIIYSSAIGVDTNSGIPHWESKFKIENHIKELGLPYTIIRPTSFYENFLIPQVRSRILKGTLSTPIGANVVQQFNSARDLGDICANIFLNPDPYLGKTITVAAEEMDMNKVTETFGEVMGRKMKYQQLPMLLTRLFMGKGNAQMFKWVNTNDARFVKNLEAFKKEYPQMTSLKDWIKLNFNN